MALFRGVLVRRVREDFDHEAMKERYSPIDVGPADAADAHFLMDGVPGIGEWDRSSISFAPPMRAPSLFQGLSR